jgi:hypothetical protein
VELKSLSAQCVTLEVSVGQSIATLRHGPRINGRNYLQGAVETREQDGGFWDVTPCGSYENLRFGGT